MVLSVYDEPELTWVDGMARHQEVERPLLIRSHLFDPQITSKCP